ncbi:acid protease [Lactarius psammicola]|nr:acid protease [Lactarius psammicola]KAI9448798.1 acid protease [Lactarius psammicola]
MSFTTHHPLRFTSAVRVSDGARAIIARDKARAQKFLAGVQPHGPNAHKLIELRSRATHHQHAYGHQQHGQRVVSPLSRDATGDTIDVTDAAVTYTASIGVGNPATDYTLLIDTGSSNTWVGADKKYNRTSTSKNTGKSVSVSYGSGSFSGTECAYCSSSALGANLAPQDLIVFPVTDQVTLSPSLIVKSQSIGVASTAQGFSDVDGILGIGPVDLTEGTIGGNTPVPTITDNLFKQGTIPTESIGIFYQPSTSASAVSNGELTFGGIDSSKITGDVNYVPITSASPASGYWGVDQNITYGSSGESILSSTAGIVDTGTTLVLIATDAFQKYQKATGATLDQYVVLPVSAARTFDRKLVTPHFCFASPSRTTGLLTLTASQFENLQSLFFNIGGVQYELTPNAQIWPRGLNTEIGGTKGKIYLVVGDLGSPSGQGLDFINGFTFLQRFYSVYDVTNSRVGLATTPFTDAETN